MNKNFYQPPLEEGAAEKLENKMVKNQIFETRDNVEEFDVALGELVLENHPDVIVGKILENIPEGLSISENGFGEIEKSIRIWITESAGNAARHINYRQNKEKDIQYDIKISCDVSTEDEKKYMQIGMMDNGTGIKPENLGKIGMEQFSTSDENKKVSGNLHADGHGRFSVGFKNEIAAPRGWEMAIQNRSDGQRGTATFLKIPLIRQAENINEGLEIVSKKEQINPEAVKELEKFSDLWIPKKVELLLVVGGFKKATEIEFESAEWYDDAKSEQVSEKSTHEFEELGMKLGLVFEKQIIATKSNVAHAEDNYKNVRNIERVTYLIAKTKDDIEKLKRADEGEDDNLYGEVYGFPGTSIDAFKNDELAEFTDIPADVRKSEEYIFTTFMLSKKDWQEELKTTKQWSDFIKRISPEIHEKQMIIMKEIVENREREFKI